MTCRLLISCLFLCQYLQIGVLVKFSKSNFLYTLPFSTALMRQWTGSALVQVMACRMFGAKLLPEPMLTSCKLDP